jgi:hypothetical protein
VALARTPDAKAGKYSDVVGIAIGGDATRLVRVARGVEAIEIIAMEERPAIRLPLSATESCDFSISTSKPLAAPYAAFAVEHPQSLMRLVALKQPPEVNESEAVSELFGAAPPEGFRIGFSAQALDGKPAGTYLACGLPDYVAVAVAALLPEGRRPAPASLQISAAARLNAFALGPASQTPESLVHIHVEAASTSVAVFNQGHLSAYRQFPIGNDSVVEEVARQFGLPLDLAGELLYENQIDTTSATTPILAPLFRQIALSTEFVARRESCRIVRSFVSGRIAGMPHWLTMGEKTLSVEVLLWNPLNDLRFRTPPTVPESLEQGPGYDAALGAALALLESE